MRIEAASKLRELAIESGGPGSGRHPMDQARMSVEKAGFKHRFSLVPPETVDTRHYYTHPESGHKLVLSHFGNQPDAGHDMTDNLGRIVSYGPVPTQDGEHQKWADHIQSIVKGEKKSGSCQDK